jgi:putative cell wall-binding protein
MLLVILALAVVVTGLPAAGQPVEVADPLYGFQGESGRIEDADLRGSAVAPTPEQLALAAELPGTVRWNPLGTPQVIINHDGWIATGVEGADEAAAARRWLRDNAALFRLGAADMEALELVVDSPLFDSPDQVRQDDPANPDVAHVVLFRQRFGDVQAGQDGLVNVGIDDGRIAWVHSTLSPVTRLNATRPTVSAEHAVRVAAGDVSWDLAADRLARTEGHDDWTVFDVEGIDDVQRARLRALPVPDGLRLAWETVVLDNRPAMGIPKAFVHFVDAVDGTVLFRSNRLDHLDAAATASTVNAPAPSEDDDFIARWKTFPANPQLVEMRRPTDPVPAGASDDRRERWCWAPVVRDGAVVVAECDRIVGTDSLGFNNFASRAPWDVDVRTNQSNNTSRGNNADTAPSCFSPFTPDPCTAVRPVPTNPSDYDFDWTNQWFEESCNPSVFVDPLGNRNDINASTTALHVGHNRMHDWGYYLGWTERNSNMQSSNFGLTDQNRENDPETGQSQAGYVTGTGNPAFGRDNANQITLPDGIPGITNQYLWQPIANAIYVPCVDGAYDMAVVGHEVGHAIQNRMTAGPNSGLNGAQARAMGESWSDLTAIEYLNGFGFVPTDSENPFSVGAYVTGDPIAGVRNYGMDFSPLNYSNIGYDLLGVQVHADGEIWSSTNFDIREAFIARYDAEFPSGDQALQTRCADGQLPADLCPGNRRWIQIIHDGFLLQPSQTSMVDSRDAMLAADRLRFGGANQDLLWDVFAYHGLGADAFSDPERDPDIDDPVLPTRNAANDPAPIPSFRSLAGGNATVTFAPSGVDGGPAPEQVRVYIGQYEARSRPVADNDPDTDLGLSALIRGGTYDFLAVADGFGHVRFRRSIPSTGAVTVDIPMQPNLASRHAGAVVTGGDGVNKNLLIDDTEATNWFSGADDNTADEPTVEGRQVTVALAGDGAQPVGRVQVSAMLRPRNPDDPGDDPTEPGENVVGEPGDRAAQNRFSALRTFQILTCNAEAGADCGADEGFSVAFTSPPDAFPTRRLRPRSPDLNLRSFDLDRTVAATHVRLRVLTNQCTGQPDFQGVLDADASNDTDCVEGRGATIIAPQGELVRAALLQVFDGPAPVLAIPGNVDFVLPGSNDPAPKASDSPSTLPPTPPAAGGPAPDDGSPTGPPAGGSPEGRSPGTPGGGTPSQGSPQTGQPGERAGTTSSVERIRGEGRIDTAVALSRRAFERADVAVIARADEFPDALAAAGLAGELDAPILLTPSNLLAPQVAAELRRLGARNAVLVGGPAALSEAIATTLQQQDVAPRRLSGPDRFATAARIAQEIVALGGPVDQAIVARADVFPDALAAGPLSIFGRAPILLTPGDRLIDTTEVALDQLLGTGDRVVVAGGPAAVSETVVADLRTQGHSPQRVSGQNRFATATALADAARAEGATRQTVLLASGGDFPDALAASPVVARLGGVLLLVDTTDLERSPATGEYLRRHAAEVSTLIVAGGPAAVSERVMGQSATAAGIR